MKKLLLSLGAVAAVAAPVAAVVACGNNSGKDEAISKLKATDIAAVNASSMTSAEKTAAIAKINSAKDIAGLTKLMQDLAPKMGATTAGNSETSTGVTTKAPNSLEESKVLTGQINSDNNSINLLKGKRSADTIEEAKIEIANHALTTIEAIADDADSKLQQVNAIVEEFVEAEGSKVAFNQKNQGKVFTFDAEAKLTWSQVDATSPITYDNAKAFIGRATPIDGNSYEALQNDVLEAAAAKILA